MVLPVTNNRKRKAVGSTGSKRAKQFKSYKSAQAGRRQTKYRERTSVVARSAAKSKNNETRKFRYWIAGELDRPDWFKKDGTGSYVPNTRHNNLALYPILKDFPGFNQFCAKFEQVKFLNLTLKARLVKNAFGANSPNSARDNNVACPIANIGNTGDMGGAVQSAGCWQYAQSYAAVDFDGKEGTGEQKFYDLQDYTNIGNTAMTSIHSGSLKTIGSFAPRLFIKPPTTGHKDITPVYEKPKWFPSTSFVTIVGNTAIGAPPIGGINNTIVSFDACGNGYDGLYTESNKPCLGVMYEVEIKCQFKGALKAINASLG